MVFPSSVTVCAPTLDDVIFCRPWFLGYRYKMHPHAEADRLFNFVFFSKTLGYFFAFFQARSFISRSVERISFCVRQGISVGSKLIRLQFFNARTFLNSVSPRALRGHCGMGLSKNPFCNCLRRDAHPAWTTTTTHLCRDRSGIAE